jgi:hypothetical protein
MYGLYSYIMIVMPCILANSKMLYMYEFVQRGYELAG